MQSAVLHGRLRDDAQNGSFVEGLRIDVVRLFEGGVRNLEGIAEPGGVCMSNDAYRQVRGKVEIACDDMGPQHLKNIVEPMQAWRLRLTGQTFRRYNQV